MDTRAIVFLGLTAIVITAIVCGNMPAAFSAFAAIFLYLMIM